MEGDEDQVREHDHEKEEDIFPLREDKDEDIDEPADVMEDEFVELPEGNVNEDQNPIKEDVIKDEDNLEDVSKLYSCPLCNQQFKRTSQLEQHTVRGCVNHYPCDVCSNVFATKLKLKQHMKLDHEKIGLQCSYCEYVAPSADYRINHMNKVHLNLKCNKCRKVVVRNYPGAYKIPYPSP